MLRFVCVVVISMSHGGCDECGAGMLLSVKLTGVCHCLRPCRPCVSIDKT